MLRLRLLVPAVLILSACGCVSSPMVGQLGDGETVVMEQVGPGQTVESRPIISAPDTLKPVTPPAELAPPPNKLPMTPTAKPVPAESSSKEKS